MGIFDSASEELELFVHFRGQLNQFGRELVPSREPVEMLVVEKAK